MKKVIHNSNNPIYFPTDSTIQCGTAINRLLSEATKIRKSKTQLGPEYMAYIEGDAVIIKEADARGKWIRRYLDLFENYCGTYNTHGKFTIVLLTYDRLGASLCSRKDSFDKDVGIAVATARALGDEIPDYI